MLISGHDELDIVGPSTLILVYFALRSKQVCQCAHFYHIQILISFGHVKAYPHVHYVGIFKNIACPLHFGLSSTYFSVTELRAFGKLIFQKTLVPLCPLFLMLC